MHLFEGATAIRPRRRFPACCSVPLRRTAPRMV